MTFKPGDEVVCVDAGPSRHGHQSTLVRGRIYTVVQASLFLGVHVAEANHDIDRNVRYVGFRPERFRPVRKTSIDIFTSMLTPTPTKENVEA